MKLFTILALLFIFSQEGMAQLHSLSLKESYLLAAKNYPLAKQRGLIEKSAAYSLANAATGNYPQAGIYGRATYQSEVTEVPIYIPGMEVPSIDKDQYKIYGEVSLNIFDGGITEKQQESIRAGATTQRRQLEVQMYALKKRINQLFFGILLMDAQIRQNQLFKKDIQLGLDNVQSAIANGTALKSEGARLRAELLKARQKTIELQFARSSYIKMLGLLMGENLSPKTILIKPEPVINQTEIERPKLKFFESKINQIEMSNALLTAKNRPQFDVFLQGGFGRPALNMLSNDFKGYYLGGIRMHIPLGGYYTLKKERALLDVKKEEVNLQREIFLLDTRMKEQDVATEIDKYHTLLATDDQIISLRESVKETVASQLKYGLAGTNDYLREVNSENQARQTRSLHEIKLLMTQYELLWTTGQLKK